MQLRLEHVDSGFKLGQEVKRSGGQSEQAGPFVFNDVLLNVESELECVAFSGHLVHDPLAVVVS